MNNPCLSLRLSRRAVVPLFLGAIGLAAAALHLPAANYSIEEPSEGFGDASKSAILNVGTAVTDASLPAFQIQHDPLTGTGHFVALDPLAAWLWAADSGYARQMFLSDTGSLTVYSPDGKTLTLNPAEGTITATDGNASVQMSVSGAATLPVVNFGNGASISGAGTGALAITSGDTLVATLNAGGIVVRGGTAAAPGLRFAGDAGTGLFSNATGVLGLSTNGTERLRVDPAGNISIGTLAANTAADERLVVIGNISLPTPGSGIKFADGTVLTSALASSMVVSGGGAVVPASIGGQSLSNTTLDGTTAMANATVQTMTAKNIATFDGYANFNSGVTFTNGLTVAKGDAKLYGNTMMMGLYYYECENEGALSIIYDDDPSPDQLIFRTAPMVDWIWQEGNTTSLRKQMVLDTNGNLTVYDATVTSNQRSITLIPGNAGANTSAKIVAFNGTGNVDLLASSAAGALLTNNGTAGLPVLSFIGDPNTGIFNGGGSGDVLGFSTAGTEKMRISSVGNVGIGTTTTSARVAIKGSDAANGTSALSLANSSNASLWEFRNDGTLLAPTNASTLKFEMGATYANYPLILINNIQNTSGTGTQPVLEARHYGPGLGLGYDWNGSAVRSFVFYTWDSPTRTPFVTFTRMPPTSPEIRYTVNITPTWNPPSGSHSGGGILIAPAINQTGGANGITSGLEINPSITNAADWRAIYIRGNNNGYAIYQDNGSSKSYFSGNIGIGTVSPDAKLAVNGTMSVSGNATFTGNSTTTFGDNTTVIFNGTVQFAEPFGDVSMGDFGN